MKLAWLRWLWLFLAVVKVHADEFAFFDAVSAGDTSAVSESLAAGVDPNYADEDGLTPLILAAKHGRLEVLGVLLKGGADIELAASYPAQVDTPLSAAASFNQTGAVKYLITHGAAVNGTGRDGRTALMTAAIKNNTAMLSFLADEHGANVDAVKLDGTSALFWASLEGHASVVLALLQRGADVRRRDYVDGSQAIHFACQKPPASSPTTSAKTTTSGAASAAESREGVVEGSRAVLSHLLTFGALPSARTGVQGPRGAGGVPQEDPKREDLSGGRTPLHVAASVGNVAAVELLLSHAQMQSSPSNGADVDDDETKVDIDALDVQGHTPLAAAAMEGRHKVISVLLAAGADPAIPGIFDARSPLHHAAFNGHLESVRRLIRDGQSMVDQPSALTNGNGPGHTPLLVACFQGHKKIVNLLLKAGASPNARAKDGATPLVAASSAGHKAIVKKLLKVGADPLAQLESGETASMVSGDRSVGRLLYLAEYQKRAELMAAKEAAQNEGARNDEDGEDAKNRRSDEGYLNLDEDEEDNAEDDEDLTEAIREMEAFQEMEAKKKSGGLSDVDDEKRSADANTQGEL